MLTSVGILLGALMVLAPSLPAGATALPGARTGAASRQAASLPSGDSYFPLSPRRIADTRCSARPAPAFCGAESIPAANGALMPLGPAPGWGPPADPDQVGGNLDSVSCVSPAFCVAMDRSGEAATFESGAWSAPAAVAPAYPGGSDLVSCATEKFCMAVGSAGYALSFDGSTWSPPTYLEANGGITSVSCGSDRFCAAVDAYGSVFTYNGSAWSAPLLVDPGEDLTSVACTSPSFCMAVDSFGQAITFDGVSWSTPVQVGQAYDDLDSVSCASASWCALGSGVPDGGLFTYDGSAWTDWSYADTTSPTESLSCTSPSFCVAVDSAGDAVSFDGATWGTPVAVSAGAALSSVSCASPSFCMAVDSAGDAVSFEGTTWGTPVAVSAGAALSSVSCTSASFCMALDTTSSAFVLGSSGWSASGSFDPVHGDLTSVSCVSAAYCVAVDSEGEAFSYSGSSWSLPELATPGAALSSVSCASPVSCQAVDGQGQAVGFGLVSHDTDEVQVGGVGGVPTGAAAAVLNVTAAAPSSAGYLSVYPAGSPVPATSTLNFSAGQTVANLVVAGLSSSGQIQVSIGGSSGSAQVVIDVEGYFAPASLGSTGESYDPTAPVRVLDTRCFDLEFVPPAPSYCDSLHGALSPPMALAPHSSQRLALPDGIASASAVVANLTVVDAGATGYLTAYPPTDPIPDTSSVDFVPGQTVSNEAYVALAEGGLDLYNGSTAPLEVVVDVEGYFSTTASSGELYYPQSPERIADTRCGGPAPPSFCASEDLPVANSALSPLGSYPAWSKPLEVDPGNSITSVSCVSASFCMAVDSAGNALSYDGVSWSAPVEADADTALVAVSCATTDFCVAVNSFQEITWDGTSWSGQEVIDDNVGITAISCPTAGFCAVVDSSGDAITYDGTSWTAPVLLDPEVALTSVSCVTASYCMAVDDEGNAFFWKGSAWSGADPVDPLGGLSSVSCVAPGSCTAVGYGGHVFAATSGSWSEEGTAGPAGYDASISCELSGGCMVADGAGDVSDYATSSDALDVVQVSGIDGVASGAGAAVLDVTVTGATHSGYITVYPAGTEEPETSTVDFLPGQTVAVMALSALGASGGVDVAIGAPVGSVQVVVDLEGDFTGE